MQRASRGRWWQLGLVVSCLAAPACATPRLEVRAPMLIPARVPVRAFPNIWVVGGETPSEIYLLDRLAVHLAADGKREIRRVESYELEPARTVGQIDKHTVVVALTTSTQDAESESLQSVPFHYCGYYGCSTDWQFVPVSAVEVVVEAKLSVFDGPSGRVLQKESFSQRAVGEERDALYQSVVEQLAAELERAVDVLRVRPKFSLYKVNKLPAAVAALEKVEAGDWEAGREQLEQAKTQLGGQNKETQAKVLFNLGIVRWVAPGPEGLSQPAYEAAQRAFVKSREAFALPELETVMAQLSEARERFQILTEQRKATAHNFSNAARAKAETPAEASPQAVDGASEDKAESSSEPATPEAPPAGESPKEAP